MLKPLLGSTTRENVLVFIWTKNEGYARRIARFFNTNLVQVQKQLDRLEFAGILASRTVVRTRLYTFDPRYPFKRKLTALLDKALTFNPQEQREKLLMNREI